MTEAMLKVRVWDLPTRTSPHRLTFFDVVGDTIWGATAAMLRDLLMIATGTKEN